MASKHTLELAEALCGQLKTYESEGSLASQAADCAPVVRALGYERLASYLEGFDNLTARPASRELTRVDL